MARFEFSAIRRYRLSAKLCPNALGPSIFPGHALNRRDDVNSYRFDTYLKNQILAYKIVNRDPIECDTKTCQCAVDTLCIFPVGPHPKVEIFGVSLVAMKGERVRSNDKILNALGVELAQQFFVVAVFRSRHRSTLQSAT